MNRFWTLYMLFFAVPFPMIIYYSFNEDRIGEPSTSLWVATALLLASAILWGSLLYKYFRKWVLTPFRIKSDIAQLLRSGARREARIVDVVRLKPAAPDVDTLEVRLEMENFAGTIITEKLVINDGKPGERRYEAGKTIRLRIDETLESRPFIIPETITLSLKRSKITLMIFCWLLLLVAVAGYYLFSYQYEGGNETGWRFLTFWHPLVLCPVILLFYRGGITTLLRTFVGDPEDLLRLKYHGQKAMAQVLSADQTGTYVNKQPQVRFELEYQNSRGERHRVSMKKIVNLLNLGLVQQKEREIFYLEDEPQNVAFVSDTV